MIFKLPGEPWTRTEVSTKLIDDEFEPNGTGKFQKTYRVGTLKVRYPRGGSLIRQIHFSAHDGMKQQTAVRLLRDIIM